MCGDGVGIRRKPSSPSPATPAWLLRWDDAVLSPLDVRKRGELDGLGVSSLESRTVSSRSLTVMRGLHSLPL